MLRHLPTAVLSAASLLLLLAAPLPGQTPGPQPAPDASSEQQGLVNDAKATFEKVQQDPEMNWFRDHASDALGFLILPKVVKVGFIFGGSGGRAVLVAKGDNGWNGPAFYSVATASVGFQAGVTVAEGVALVMTKKGLESLLSSASVKFGGDISAAAGPVGTGAGGTVDTDLVVFTKAKGLYGGVSINGAVIKPTDDWNRAYYGQLVSPIDILVRGSFRSPGAGELLATIRRTAESK